MIVGTAVGQVTAKHYQILRDDQTAAKCDVEEMTDEQRDNLIEHEALQLKAMFQQELEADEEARRQSLSQSLGLQATRKPNRDWIKKLDNMLQVGTTEGLSKYLPTRWLQRLQEGDVREFVTVPAGDTEEKRSLLACTRCPRSFAKVHVFGQCFISP